MSILPENEYPLFITGTRLNMPLHALQNWGGVPFNWMQQPILKMKSQVRCRIANKEQIKVELLL